MVRSNLRLGAFTLAAAMLIAAAEGDVVPWPRGVAPSTSELQESLSHAEALYALDRMEEFLEAAERGEDSEHMTIRQEDIDSGFADLARIFRVGDALFAHEFRNEDGLGNRADAPIRRVHDGIRGGLDSYSCAGCHSLGGSNGAGSATQNAYLLGDGATIPSAVVRSAPHVLGVGVVQALGVEMTSDLQFQRDTALEAAVASGLSQTVELSTKGVSFGTLLVTPAGEVDSTKLVGVDDDLVVKPFGWKGDTARLRRFIEDAARVHFGIQSHPLALSYESTPNPELLGPGPWYDPDNDGRARELEDGTLTAGAVYLAMLESPIVLPPFDRVLRERWARGSEHFDAIGCTGCHVRTLNLTTGRWFELPDTTSGTGVELNLFRDGDAPRSTATVELFSDLKRHDLGEALADEIDHPAGIARSEFITRPLWGLADTAPFLHDGRATTLDEAIRLHGGEAASSASAYVDLGLEAQRDLHVFLLSLTRNPRLRIAP